MRLSRFWLIPDQIASDRNMPRQATSLDLLEDGEQDHADGRQHDDGSELACDIEVGGRYHDQITETAVRTYELGHDSPDDGETASSLHPGKNTREGIRKLKPPEDLKPCRSHGPREVEHLGAQRFEPDHRVDDDRKEGHEYDDDDFGANAESEPHQKQRRQ